MNDPKESKMTDKKTVYCPIHKTEMPVSSCLARQKILAEAPEDGNKGEAYRIYRKSCGECKIDLEVKMKKETEKERVNRRMAALNKGPGKERFVICCNCKNNDETCSMCGSCISGSNFEPRANGNYNCSGRFVQDRLFADAKNDTIAQDYKAGSVVAERKDAVQKLVNAHWNYMAKVLTIGADIGRTYTFDEVMAMREWDYTSAAIHFYGHGFEDGSNKFAEKTLNRLKEA